MTIIQTISLLASVPGLAEAPGAVVFGSLPRT
jgi:hypothetical protein